jgi:hypothetical protein
MPRTAAKVTQADITRVLRAVKAAGVDMRVEIAPDGTIRLEPAGVAGRTPPRYDGDIKL